MFEPEFDSPLEYLAPPYRRFTIGTLAPPDATLAALARIVEPRRLWRTMFSTGTRAFQGVVATNGFKISRIISYRNSFLPMIIGHFEPAPTGTRVVVTMRMAWPAIIFCLIWLAVCAAMALSFAAPTVAGPLLSHSRFSQAFTHPRGAMDFFPLGVLAFGYLLCSTSFAYEARKARRMLRDELTAPGERVDF